MVYRGIEGLGVSVGGLVVGGAARKFCTTSVGSWQKATQHNNTQSLLLPTPFLPLGLLIGSSFRSLS